MISIGDKILHQYDRYKRSETTFNFPSFLLPIISLTTTIFHLIPEMTNDKEEKCMYSCVCICI